MLPACTSLRLFFVMLCGLLLAGCNRPATEQAPGQRGADSAGTSAQIAAPQKIVTKSGIEMVLIPAGEFLMGDAQGEDDEKPAREVELSAFCMDVCEVTQASCQGLMGRNPSKFRGEDRPAERLSWQFAIQYCNMRSLREGLKPCYDLKTQRCDFAADGYRLPTEAEWEYACRAGTASAWSFGDDAGEAGQARLVQGQRRQDDPPGQREAPQPLGPLRHARQRGRVVQRFLCGELRQRADR